MTEGKDDITRYRNNEMSEKERNAFEKKALNDPFLAEALEGAESVSPEEFSNDVHSLVGRIAKPKSHRLLVPARIAAGVVVAVTIGWFSLRPNQQPSETAVVDKPDSVSVSRIDSGGTLLTAAEPTREQEDKKSKADITASKASSKPGALAQQTPSEQQVASATSSGAGAQPQVTPVTTEKEAKTVADLAIADEAVKEEESTPEKARDAKSARMKQSDAAPRAAGVAAREMQAKDDDGWRVDVRVLRMEGDSVDSASTPAAPVGGMEAYRSYLTTNVRFPKEAIAAKVTGMVTIIFTITSSGALTDFQSVKPSGHGCEEELVRLVNSGPKWIPGSRRGIHVWTVMLVGMDFDYNKAR